MHHSEHQETNPEDEPHERAWRERGASLVEYALLVALIAVTCLGAVGVFGGGIGGSIQNSANEVTNAMTP